MVKDQGHQAALLTALLARQAAATVGVGTCWPWETAATLPSARRRKALRHPRGRRGAGHIVAAARPQLVTGNYSLPSVKFSALTLLLGRLKGYPACKKTDCRDVGGGDLTAWCFVRLTSSICHVQPSPSTVAAAKSRMI